MSEPVVQQLDLFSDVPVAVAKRNAFGGTVYETLRSSQQLEESSKKVSSKTEEPFTASNATNGVEKKRRKKIEDFGEKIGGARKDVFQAYRAMLSLASEMEIEDATTISTAWPIPNYEKLIEKGVDSWRVDTIRALRDAVPSKPRFSYNAERLLMEKGEWGHIVRILRDTAIHVLDGTYTEGDVEKVLDEALPFRGYDYANETSRKNISDKVSNGILLYRMCGHSSSLAHLRMMYVFRGSGMEWVVGKNSGGRYFSVLGEGKTREEAISSYRSKHLEKPKKKDTSHFYHIYRQKEKGKPDWFFIGRSLGNRLLTVKERFTSVKEAAEYKVLHLDELEERFSQMRKIPFERGLENRERIGILTRKGDITPEAFLEAFRFRGVEFGNYVDDKRRQEDLNDAHDALMDLSYVTNIRPGMLSLGGTLGLAFGARGRGGQNAPMAHYEPDMSVINLTKRKGAGSLGHEWFHALDNHLAHSHHVPSTYATNAPMEFREGNEALSNALRELDETISLKTGLAGRSRKLDSTRKKPYFSDKVEMAARAFEAYLKRRLAAAGIENDYLVNIKTEEEWNQSPFSDLYPYPYPTEKELDLLEPVFHDMLSAIEERERDGRTVLYSASRFVDDSGKDTKILPVEELSPYEHGLCVFGEKVLGIETMFFEGDERLHGKFDRESRTIFLNRNSDISLPWVMFHESFHAVREEDPSLYKDILSFAGGNSMFSKELMDAYRKEHDDMGMPDDLVMEEMLADAFADIRTGKRVAAALAEERPRAAGKLLGFFERTANRMKRFFFGEDKEQNEQKNPEARLPEEGFHALQKHLDEIKTELLHGKRLTKGEEILLLAMTELPEGVSPVSPYLHCPEKQRDFDRAAFHKLCSLASPRESSEVLESLSPLGYPGYAKRLLRHVNPRDVPVKA